MPTPTVNEKEKESIVKPLPTFAPGPLPQNISPKNPPNPGNNQPFQTLEEKIIDIFEDYILIEFKKDDTEKLEPGKYFWDVKIYTNPEYDDDGLIINASEINSYYSAFEEPVLIIKEVAKNYE